MQKFSNQDQVIELLLDIKSTLKFHNKKWLRTSETADYLGISITQVHNLKREGILPYSKVGGTIYFKKQDIDIALETSKTEV
ncbi:MAG: helix-turn-helix domain-containing protein [Balneolaceae bacterium]